ncbi:MAG: hypothetical protein M9962_14345 [Oligoflexia bacterium]|nr:hypothetical protein [Oligoflexia bacterium]
MDIKQVISSNVDEVSEIIYCNDPVSVFEDYVDFKVLLIRRIELQGSKLDFRIESFILKNAEVYYLADQTKKEFSRLSRDYRELNELLDKFYRSNQKILQAYSNQIEQLEDYLFERKVPGVFMDIWFDLKKDLSKLENYYYRNGIVYHEFYRKCESLFGELKDEFKDIEETIQFHIANISALKSRLDGLHHYYVSIKNDRVNKILFFLTVISGVFLPLNLIVGFFGMNTQGLFFSDSPHATWNVVAILFLVLIISVMVIPVVHFIDRYILRLILGRYDFYRNISARIDELGDRLRGK